MKKIIIQWDLDGVLVQYPNGQKPECFLSLPPIQENVEIFKKLCEDPRYECYVASTAPWSNPQAWMDKRLWVEKYLGEDCVKRLTLTHNKQLLIGQYLVDDRPSNGASEFQGKWIHYKQGETNILEEINYKSL